MDDYHTTTSPPSSEIFSDEQDSVSLRPKINSKGGYVPVSERSLNKTVLRGRKTFAFWTLIALLFILAVGNLILTMTILGVLRLGQGMQSVELVPKEYAIKLFGEVDLDNIYKRDGKIEGFLEEPMKIQSENSPILINLANRNGRSQTKIKIDENGTFMRGLNSFEVKNEEGAIFSVTDPLFTALKQTKSLHTKQIDTNRVRSPVHDSLKIEGDQINLKGAEGTKIAGRELVWAADQDIYLKSMNGSIVLSSVNGTYVDVTRISIAKPKSNSFFTPQFKVCVCMPQGKLFRIPIASPDDRVYCHHFNSSPQNNPCI